MKLSVVKKIANRLLKIRGLRLAPHASYGLSQAADISKLWQDLSLPSPTTIIDIGANRGLFSLEVESFFPSAKILAVEPNPSLASHMKSSSLFRKIEVIQAAIGNSCQPASLNIYAISGIEDTPISSLLHYGSFADVHNIKPSRQINVEIVTLDNFCLDRNIAAIDICKIDVEGYEIQVLQGAASLLEAHSIKVLSIEWSTRGGQARSGETTLVSLISEMARYNYLPIGSSIDWCKKGPYYFNNNMLFISGRLLDVP